MHMKKYAFIALTLILAAAPMRAEEPSAMQAEMSMTQSKPEICVSGNTINVLNGQGAEIYVYDITGKEVYHARVDSANKSFSLDLKRGCYIVKVGDTTRKITIQ